jgi:hypothetical protein
MPVETSFHTISIDNLLQVADFCSSFPTDGRPMAFWQARLKHWWETNPASRPDTCLGTRLMAEDKIVGTSLAIPMLALVDGEPRTMTTRSSWRVLPEYRSQSLATEAFNNKMLFGQLNITSTPIASTRPLLAMWGWQPLRDTMTNSIIPANLIAVIGRLMRRRLRTRPLARVISNTDEHQTFASADSNWAATAATCTFGPVRNAAYYSWYSVKNPTMPFTTFANVAENPADSSFALATHYNDGALHVTDLWPWTAPVATLRTLIGGIVKVARANLFHTVRIPHLSPAIAAACTGTLGSRLQKNTEHLMVHYPASTNPAGTHCWPINSGDVGI